jgi:hypothetical protein
MAMSRIFSRGREEGNKNVTKSYKICLYVFFVRIGPAFWRGWEVSNRVNPLDKDLQ